LMNEEFQPQVLEIISVQRRRVDGVNWRERVIGFWAEFIPAFDIEIVNTRKNSEPLNKEHIF